MSNSRLLGFVMNGVMEEGGKSYKYRYRYKYRYQSKYAYVATGKKNAGTKPVQNKTDSKGGK